MTTLVVILRYIVGFASQNLETVYRISRQHAKLCCLV